MHSKSSHLQTIFNLFYAFEKQNKHSFIWELFLFPFNIFTCGNIVINFHEVYSIYYNNIVTYIFTFQ